MVTSVASSSSILQCHLESKLKGQTLMSITNLDLSSHQLKDFEDISLDGAHNITMGRMNQDNNTSAQNTSANTSDDKTLIQTRTNSSNFRNDDIIHRFQFFYLPKRNAYGFSSDKIKKINRRSRNSNVSRLKRKKRKNFRKKKKVDNLIEESIDNEYQNHVFQNKHDSSIIHEVRVYSTESPFPSLHLNYRFHDLSSV